MIHSSSPCVPLQRVYRRRIAATIAILLAAAGFGEASILGAQIAPPVQKPTPSPTPAPPPVMAVTPAQVGLRAEPEVDPARLAAARPVIDQIWPTGTYARAMRGALDELTRRATEQITGANASATPGKDAPGAAVRSAIAEMSVNDDPYAAERTRIVLRVMTDEMAALMASFEPDVRDALAKAYAKRFTVEQLTTLHAFFETPAGRAYARDSVAIMMGPDMIGATKGILPKIVEAMPGIMAKAEAATKDLPPPPTRKRR